MPTTLPVPYSHTIDGFIKGVDDSGPFYKVTYLIDDWSMSDQFCNVVMGFGSSTGSGGGITVTKSAPHQHPLSPNLFARSAVVVQGLGKPIFNSNGYPDYDGGALIEVEYRSPPFDFGGSGTNFLNNQIDSATPLSWCTQEIDFTSTTFTLPNSRFRYTGGPGSGTFTDVYVKFEVPTTLMTLTFHQLPYMPVAGIRNLQGRVNNATFLGCPAECVLFKGGKTSREPNPDGTIVQTVTLTFEARDASQPWNSLPSSSDPTFYPVAGGVASDIKMYKTANLASLVQF